MLEDPNRRRFVAGVGSLGVAALAGCTGGPTGDGNGDGGNGNGGSGNGGTDDETPAGGGDDSEPTAHVGMVYALGGLGDKSFNDAAHRGVQQAKEELGIAYEGVEPNAASEFSQFQRQFAESTDPKYDLVSCIGFAQKDALTEVAPDYPDQNFLIVDDVVEEDNVASYTFKEHEGSYLVGHLAGLLTTREFSVGEGENERATNPDEPRIGFVGGVDAPLIRKFQAGFEAGAKAVDEGIDVDVAYTGSFSDPSTGRDAALSMYDNGADVVYHAAGGSGVGVFQAAQDEGRFAIGVDSDQSITEADFADVIVASMVKKVETAIFESVKNVVDDNFKGGTKVSLGLEEEGVACVYGDQLGDEIPGEIKDEVSAARQAIIDGEIEVPTEPQ